MAGLVYIAAFAPDQGESVQALYLVSTDDKMIPPDAQRLMPKRAGAETVEVKGSHAVYVSQPEAVAALIERAANDASSMKHTHA